MSLNTCHAGSGVVLYAGEYILLYCNNVTLTFECSEPNMKGDKKGRIYLTTHRMIFRSNTDSKGLQSFSFPFYTLHNLGLEQPVFGANYIRGTVKAEHNGGWTGNANFKLTFKNGGAIEYGQALMAAGQLASRYMGNQPPPPYSAPTVNYVNAQNYMAPPGAAPYGFHVPTNVFPEQPPANQVYMYEMPPPYPGVMGVGYVGANGAAYVAPPAYGQPGQYPPQQQYQPPQAPTQHPPQMGTSAPQGYPGSGNPPGTYPAGGPAPGGYPAYGGYTAAAGNYPPAGGYPAPGGYSAPSGYPAPGGYSAPTYGQNAGGQQAGGGNPAAYGGYYPDMGPPPAYAPGDNKKKN
jgi:hypothetical protein